MRQDLHLRVTRLLAEGVAGGALDAAAAVIGDAFSPWAAGAAGALTPGGQTPVDEETLFDLASVTKPFVATLALALDATGELPLETPLGECLEAGPHAAGVSLGDLLGHRSRIRSWAPLYALCSDPDEVTGLLLAASLWDGDGASYGDLGYILWARVCEARAGEPLADSLRRRVLEPLGIGLSPARAVAACRLPNDREVELAAAQGVEVAPLAELRCGVAQDGNARFLGGVAGHAGLFASARDLWRLGSEWLRPGRVLTPGAVRRALSGDGRFALGWWRQPAAGSEPLGRGAFGHPGFTGCSLWLDPDRGMITAVAGHRPRLVDLAPWRRGLHEITTVAGG